MNKVQELLSGLDFLDQSLAHSDRVFCDSHFETEHKNMECDKITEASSRNHEQTHRNDDSMCQFGASEIDALDVSLGSCDSYELKDLPVNVSNSLPTASSGII